MPRPDTFLGRQFTQSINGTTSSFYWSQIVRSGHGTWRAWSELMTFCESTSDQELLRAYARENSHAAFGAIVDRHARWMFASAFRQLGDRQLAEDATQAVFVLLAQKAGKMAEPQKLSGWLFRALGYTVKTLRRAGRRRRLHEQQAASERSIVQETDPDISELAARLDVAVAGLAGRDRTAILLRFYQERSFGQIAEALGISEAAARKRVLRGTVRLRKLLMSRLNGAEVVAALSAAAATGVDSAPGALAQSAARVALAHQAGVGISSSVLTASKGTAYLMAASTKIKILAIGLIVFCLAVPTSVLVYRYSPDLFSFAAPSDASPAAAGDSSAQDAVDTDPDDFWRVQNLSSYQVGIFPPRVKILPTKFPLSAKTRLTGAAPGVGKFVGIGVTVRAIVAIAYKANRQQVIFESAEPTLKYDFISTLAQGSSEALQGELKTRLGLVGRWENRTVDALLMRVRNPGARGLHKPTPGGEFVFEVNDAVGQMRWDDQPLSRAPELLDFELNMPVIDQTGLTQHFSVDVDWEEVGDRDPDHDALKKAVLENLGIELVPSREPVEVLVVGKISG
jgi:uncharacterized protein (TIGR03435 family)